MFSLSNMLPGLFVRQSHGRLFALVALAVFCGASLACSKSGSAQEDTYIDDIHAEATRTAELNDRTEALLDHNELLSATATAAYAEFGDTQEPLRVLSQDLALLLEQVQALLQAEHTGQVCDQLTASRLQNVEGVDEALAGRIRTEFSCTDTQ